MTDHERSKYVLQATPLAQAGLVEKIASSLDGIVPPTTFELTGAPEGARLYGYGSMFDAFASAFTAHARHALTWKRVDTTDTGSPDRAWVLRPKTALPAMRRDGADPFLTWAGTLCSAATALEGNVTLQMHVTGKDPEMQGRLRELSAFDDGARMDDDTGYRWALQSKFIRVLACIGGAMTALATGALFVGWLWPTSIVLFLAGLTIFIAAAIASRRRMEIRSTPPDVLKRFTTGSLLRVSFVLTMRGERAEADGDRVLSQLTAGGLPFLDSVELVEADPADLDARGALASDAFPVPTRDLATLLTPAETGDPSTVLHPETLVTVPSPPSSRALRTARFRIGRAVAGGAPIGIDPDGHGLIVGGSQSGKSSLVYALLRQLLDDDDPPGLFLVDPHLSLADAILSAIASLPADKRQEAIDRLLIITPDQPEVVPLNLLAVPDFTWAGNTLIQVGKRIWGEFWGPRMQAALQALFRLAHGWNTATDDPDERLSLFHLVFAAFRERWRQKAMMTLPPDQRMGPLALNTLLGEFAGRHGSWHHSWLTKVVSPIISKVMAVELAPWLFQALHQPQFVDLEAAIEDKAWIILRVPSGTLGREGSRLLSAVVYNIWESAFRKVASPEEPIPYYVVVDEAQEIAAGMELETLLSEGAKFGARVFVLTQSLAMLRRTEGFERVVQSLLANTSTQAFFSPGAEDVELVRDVLSSRLRYGDMTLDLPSLTCWLRARIDGAWQSPVLMETDPLAFARSDAVTSLIREVIEAHPEYYVSPEFGVAAAIRALQQMLPERYQDQFDEMMGRVSDDTSAEVPDVAADTDAEAETADGEDDNDSGPSSRRDRLGL